MKQRKLSGLHIALGRIEGGLSQSITRLISDGHGWRVSSRNNAHGLGSHVHIRCEQKEIWDWNWVR